MELLSSQTVQLYNITHSVHYYVHFTRGGGDLDEYSNNCGTILLKTASDFQEVLR
jgi:hypothetical protein